YMSLSNVILPGFYVSYIEARSYAALVKSKLCCKYGSSRLNSLGDTRKFCTSAEATKLRTATPIYSPIGLIIASILPRINDTNTQIAAIIATAAKTYAFGIFTKLSV